VIFQIALVLALFLLIWSIVRHLLSRFGTVYVRGPWGYTATSSRDPSMHQADPHEFMAVVERLLTADLYDMLHVSWEPNRYSGIMICTLRGHPELRISFKVHGEQEQCLKFKQSMSVLDFPVTESSDGFNGGFSESCRITSLAYRLPESPGVIANAVDVALATLSGSQPDVYFLSGSLFAHGPGRGSGIKFSPYEDPLASVIPSSPTVKVKRTYLG